MIKEFEKKYAVIDLEATNAGSTASIIQVGIVILQGGEIRETFQTDVNPHEPLSEHIKSLTGISDEQLSKAPDFSQVAKTIYDLIHDCIFVAHNVKFDANLLAESLFFEGFELRTPRIDTVELAQVFYPTFEKYNLSVLSSELGLDLSDAHTAIADAIATAKLFLKLQEKISQIPLETLEGLADLSDNLIFETGQMIRDALIEAKPYDERIYEKVNHIVLRRREQVYTPLKLSQDFAINTALLGLDNRPLQNDFAHLVESHFTDQRASFIQAQAGIGKSYGYLLPLIARAEDKQILISVPTKILQDQMMAKELKSIEEAFHVDCHSIKGPANYIKLDRFYQSLQKVDDNRLVNRYKMQLLVWLLETKTGDLDEIKQKQRFAAYFEMINHDGDLLLTSPFSSYDFWQRSYEKAKRTSVLLTNHAYFLHRVEDDKAFAKGKIVVFDEAQNLIIQLDQLARKQLNLTQFLQDLQGHIEASPSLLQKRLLEGLSFELEEMANHFYLGKEKEAKHDQIERIQKILSELDSSLFQEIRDIFRHEDGDYWISSEKNDEKRFTYLNSSSKQFTDFKQFLPDTLKTYFISATLHISSQVTLAQLLGYEDYLFATIAKEKSQQQLVILDKDMPQINQIDDETYAYEIAERLARLLVLQKPILVLFNSRKHMLMVSDLLDQSHISHLTQEKNGTAYNVKKRFDRGEQKLLLGMGSFWEGVDFFHADRMIEVITRLPFDNPQDLFVKRMNTYLIDQGKKPFNDYFLPMTLLKLKQAIGRTMRRENQKSAVLILDNRILTQHYGQFIYDSLHEEFLTTYENFDNSMVEMSQFLI